MVFGNSRYTNPDMSIIPSFATLNEATYYVLEANEAAFTQMLKKIGIRELGLFESAGSSSILYEAEGEAETKKEIEKFKVGLWTRIKTLFENAMVKIKTFIQKFVLSISMHFGKKALDKDIYNELVEQLPKVDTKVSRYPWGGLQETINKFEDVLASIVGDNELASANKMEKEGFTGADIKNFMRGESTSIPNDYNVKEAKKKDVSIKSLSSSQFETIYKHCTDFKQTEANLKTMYQAAKSSVEMATKKQKYDMNAMDSGDDKNQAKEQLKAIKYVGQITILFAGTALSEYYAMIASNMSIITTVYKSYNKNKKDKKDKDKAKNEAAYDSELSSLFDWTY